MFAGLSRRFAGAGDRVSRKKVRWDIVRYTVVLSGLAHIGAAVVVPAFDLLLSGEPTLYNFWLGQLVTAVVAPPICYWSATKFYMACSTRRTLEVRNVELAAAKAKAEEAAEVKSRFLAIMSHEIRTPLNGVLGMAQLLARRPLESEDKILADTLLESGQSLMTLLNDLLDLSRVEAGQMQVAPVRASLQAELRQIQFLFAPMAAEKGIAFQIELDPHIPETLIFDPVRLRQCVGNLVSNAIKFTQTGRVRVQALQPSPGQLVVSVEDSGLGLSADEQAQIFDAFVQASARTAQSHGGSGLGLTICRQLAQLMGGDVTVRSTLGIGSVFTLSIQVDEPELNVSTDADTVADGCMLPEQWLEGREVLVVDDVATNRLVLGSLLERTGALVRLAEGGAEALDMHATKPADLVLLDLQMPEMDGFETARRLRTSPRGEVPVIAISAHAHSEDREACFAAGMDGLMLKPIELRALYSEIARLDLAGPRDGSGSASSNAA